MTPQIAARRERRGHSEIDRLLDLETLNPIAHNNLGSLADLGGNHRDVGFA
jgi:hypothetical protein